MIFVGNVAGNVAGDRGIQPEPHFFSGAVVFGSPCRGERVHQCKAATVLTEPFDRPDPAAVWPAAVWLAGPVLGAAVLSAPDGMVGRCQPVGVVGARRGTQRGGIAVADRDRQSGGVVAEVDCRVGAGVHDDVGHEFGHQQQNGVDQIGVDPAAQCGHDEPPGRPR